MTEPVLILDVDGVINPQLRRGQTLEDLKRESWPDWAPHYIGSKKHLRINASRELGYAIRNLGVDVAWLSDWEEQIDPMIVRYYGLPPGYERLPYDYMDFSGINAVKEYIAYRESDFAWCYTLPLTEQEEDSLMALAAEMDVQCMLVHCHEEDGLYPADLDDLAEFFSIVEKTDKENSAS